MPLSTCSPVKAHVLSGYTEHNKLINFKGDASMVGQSVDDRVTEAKTWALTGEQVESGN